VLNDTNDIKKLCGAKRRERSGRRKAKQSDKNRVALKKPNLFGVNKNYL